jgi:hypothetical protein
MHFIACWWISIGLNEEIVDSSWISKIKEDSRDNERFVYITSIYWVMSTLTTVGYGDQKGYTPLEYGFTMGVEFVGILVFSIMMGFINDIFDKNEDDEEDSAKL